MEKLRIAALLILVAVPYLTALDHAFVYDDQGSILENAHLDEPGLTRDILSLRTLTDPAVQDGRRPTVLLTYLFDRALWGLRPAGFHATSLLIHLLNTILVLVLTRQLAPKEGPSILPTAAALLFGLHPVLTEAVQSPAFREDLLATFFVLSFVILTTRRDAGSWLSIPALILGLLSKESAAAAPLLLFAAWLCVPAIRPPPRRAAGLAACSLAAVLLFGGLWVVSGPLQASGDTVYGTELRHPQNLLTLPYLWLKSLRVLLVPHPLIVDYVIRPVHSITDPRCLAGFAAGLLSVAAFFLLLRRRPVVAFGIAWMLAAFLPASNLIPLYNPFAERYLYGMAPGFALAFASIITSVSAPRGRIILLAAAVTAYACLTTFRLADWRDNLTLWTRTIQDEPQSARAYTWVGLEMKHQRDPRGAMLMFNAARSLNPHDISPLVNMAIIEGEQGRLPEAEALLREALAKRPDKADVHWNLAVALQLQGKTNEAQEEIRQTLKHDPGHPEARSIQNMPPHPLDTRGEAP